jgi:hypothetical protein
VDIKDSVYLVAESAQREIQEQRLSHVLEVRYVPRISARLLSEKIIHLVGRSLLYIFIYIYIYILFFMCFCICVGTWMIL